MLLTHTEDTGYLGDILGSEDVSLLIFSHSALLEMERSDWRQETKHQLFEKCAVSQ